MYDCGVRVICIHGRTRGSTKHRRVGPADLETIAKIAFDLHRYHQSHLDCNQECLKHLFVISNGNIITPHDIQRNVEYYQGLHSAEFSPPLIGGVMSGEGVLKDPAIFHRYLQLSHPSSSITQPTLKELFTEYCYLSNLYASLNGWEGLDILERKKSSSHQLFEIGSSNESVSSPDSRQLSIARQHLNWILGKSGHGRLIRYQYKADSYKRHTDLMNDINNCKTIQELLEIAETCLI